MCTLGLRVSSAVLVVCILTMGPLMRNSVPYFSVNQSHRIYLVFRIVMDSTPKAKYGNLVK